MQFQSLMKAITTETTEKDTLKLERLVIVAATTSVLAAIFLVVISLV